MDNEDVQEYLRRDIKESHSRRSHEKYLQGSYANYSDQNNGLPPPMVAALAAQLRAFGMSFPNYESKGLFEGFGPYSVDNIIEFDSARRENTQNAQDTITNGKISFQVADFMNDANTSNSIQNLVQMKISEFYIPLCGNEKIARWGTVQIFICEFLSDSASRNREQRGNWHWEMRAEVEGPRIRLIPKLNLAIYTFRVPIKNIPEVFTFLFRTPSGPLVFCNEFAPGNAVNFDGALTFQTLQGGTPVNHGFLASEIVSLERKRPPGGPNSYSGQWLPDEELPGVDVQGMLITGLPSTTEIDVDAGDITSATEIGLAPPNVRRLHNLSRQVLIPIKFTSIRDKPTQYLVPTAF